MIFVIGDIHGCADRVSKRRWPSEYNQLTKNDFLVFLGDFGLLWQPRPTNEEIYWLKWLSKKPWTTLVVDGNHENFERLYALPEVELFGGKVGVIAPDIYHLKRGEIYEIDGQKVFVLGGGLSWDKNDRTPFVDWWPQEIPSKTEFDNALDNLDKIGWNPDFIWTHVPPRAVAKAWEEKLLLGPPSSLRETDLVSLFLNMVWKKATWKKWYCGHMHTDTSIVDGEKEVEILYQNILRIH